MNIARILIGLFVLVLIAGGGFLVGRYASEHTGKSGLSLPAKRETSKPNLKTYYISPPSIGVMSSTITVDIPAGNFLPYVELPATQAGAVRTGQKAVVKDAQDRPLDLIAEVIAVREVSPDKIGITIGIKAIDAALLNKAQKAAIEVARETSVSRLPTEAIISGEDGQSRIWEVRRNDDGTTSAYLKGVTVLALTENFAAIMPSSGSSDTYILNPDDRLIDGATINVEERLYAGREFTEADKIALSLSPQWVKSAEKIRQGRKRIERGSQTNASCPVPSPTSRFMTGINGRAALPVSAPSAPAAPLPISTPAP